MLPRTIRHFPLAVLLVACHDGGAPLEGLAPAHPDDRGPRIVWNVEATPVPEIPFPNDVGTRPAADSPTGRKVNVPLASKTRHERRLRELISELDGFGTYSPIWVRFDERIDVVDVHRRQNNDDPTDDALYLVNVDPESARFGEPVPLDLGGGRFPVVLDRPTGYFMNDPRPEASNVLFETVDEDENGDGVLQREEDTDFDGQLDKPNVWGELLGDPTRMDGSKDLLTFYELASNTLIARPVLPLEERSTYAVLLTRRIVAADDGSPIRSPFPFINHTNQTPALAPLVGRGALARLGLHASDLAFAWTFTTQTVTKDLEAVRSGLYGQGPFARLGRDFPPRLASVLPLDTSASAANTFVLQMHRFVELLRDPGIGGKFGLHGERASAMLDTYEASVDYIVAGTFESPAFLENDDGLMRANAHTGEISYSRATVPFMCVVPRAQPGHTAPFPVVLHAHGYTSSRLEFYGFAASMARLALATCAIDAYGHGVTDNELLRALMVEAMGQYELSAFATALFNGRARDLNHDGFTDSGGDFWTANSFHTRDVVRQSMVDYFQWVRVLRSFGSGTMAADVDGDGAAELTGDFNGDGVVDFGGDRPLSIMGSSLGGILAAALGGFEPAFTAAAPISGGGGLTDITVRTTQVGAVQAVNMPALGPFIATRSSATGDRIDLVQNILDVNEEYAVDGVPGLRFASIPDPRNGLSEPLEIGDRIVVENLVNGERSEVHILPRNDQRLVRAPIAADFGDAIRVSLYRAGASSPYRVIDTFEREALFHGRTYEVGSPLRVLQTGFGLRRNSPKLRELLGIGQAIVDPADPINYARFYGTTKDWPGAASKPSSLLVVNTVGDTNVPINAGVAFARAAGALGDGTADPRYGITQDQLLVDTFVVEGIDRLARFESSDCHYFVGPSLFDIDDAARGIDPDQGPRLGAPAPAPWCLEPCAPRPPLRATHASPAGATLAARFLYLDRYGAHSIGLPHPSRAFDYNLYQVHQIARFFATEGAEVVDDPCLEDLSCAFFPAPR